MGTTSLIVEFVIIGFQVTTWIFLLFLTIWGYDQIDLPQLSAWAAPIAVALIIISYTFGVLFDAILSALFSSWNFSITKEIAKNIDRVREAKAEPITHISPMKMKTYILAKDSNQKEYLDKLFNQVKLTRATSLNLLLIGLTGLLLVGLRVGFSWQSFLSVLVIILFALLALSFWKKTYHAFYNELALFYTATRDQAKQNKTQRRK